MTLILSLPLLMLLLALSQVPTSVAITPDGFRAARHIGTYSLVLRKRQGFVRLAHDTGALLVPVLGVGEPNVIKGGYTPLCLAGKFFNPSRVSPIKVVFGPAVGVVSGESLDDTHKRYMEALLALGKEHGVQLDIVE